MAIGRSVRKYLEDSTATSLPPEKIEVGDYVDYIVRARVIRIHGDDYELDVPYISRYVFADKSEITKS